MSSSKQLEIYEEHNDQAAQIILPPANNQEKEMLDEKLEYSENSSNSFIIYHQNEQYEYIEQVSDELMCAICHDPFVDPVSHNSCGNTFCSKCVVRIEKCPMCSEDDFKKNCVPSVKTIRNMLDKLKVKCSMCKNIVSRGELKDHKERYCPLHDAYKQVEQLKEQLQQEFNEFKKLLKIEHDQLIETTTQDLIEQREKVELELKEKTEEFDKQIKLKEDLLAKQKIEFDSQVLAREKFENINKPIHLNVGGSITTVSLGDFINNEREPNNLFKKMFNGEYPLYQTPCTTFKDSVYFINCDPIIFNHIIDWLKYGIIPDLSNASMKKLLIVAKSFGIDFRKVILPYINTICEIDFSGMELNDIIMKGGVLKNCNFTNCELVNARISDCKFILVDFTNVNTEKCKMENVTFEKCKAPARFNNANLKNCKFIESICKESDFSNCLLGSISFQSCDLTNLDFNVTGSSLKSTIFKGSNLRGSSFSNFILESINFEDCDLVGCNFSNASLKSTSFKGGNLNGTDLSNCLLDSINFQDCDLSDCNFSNAVFKNVNLTNAKLSNSNITNATFEKSKTSIQFTNNNLKDCKFIECELSNTKFIECELSGSNFNQTSFTNTIIEKSNVENVVVEKSKGTIHFKKNTLKGCKLIESKLFGCIFEEVEFIELNSNENNLFNNCIIKNSDLKELKDLSKFSGCIFDSCLFNFNQFTYKTIENIKFENISFEEIDFKLNEFKFRSVEMFNCKGIILESSIIGYNYNTASTLIEETKSKLNPKLLYRGSRDGFKTINFHSKCDNQGATLTIIKSHNDQIFGGFTSQSWQSPTNGCYVSDDFAFIFKILNSANGNYQFKKFNITQNRKHNAIYLYNYYLVRFGGDFCIYNDCNLNNSSYSNFGDSYELPNELKYGSNEAKNFMAGSNNFQVIEIEVFKIYQ